MLELELDDELESDVFMGMYNDMPMSVYREAPHLANSEAQIFEVNPASYIWNKTAPSDPSKATTAEFGTALHTALLEPHLFEDSVIVSGTKGRTAESFIEFQRQHSDLIALTEKEYDQIKLMAESAKCDPLFKQMLECDGAPESSIFVKDPETGLNLKIRPDKIITLSEQPFFGDVKSSADLNEWRQDKQWLNPLFKMGYGFTAAYYMYVGSILYGFEMTRYAFMVVSKSALLGKYPASVFMITKEELIEYGFWERMLSTLKNFAIRSASGKFSSYENFPQFYMYNEDNDNVEVSYESTS